MLLVGLSEVIAGRGTKSVLPPPSVLVEAVSTAKKSLGSDTCNKEFLVITDLAASGLILL